MRRKRTCAAILSQERLVWCGATKIQDQQRLWNAFHDEDLAPGMDANAFVIESDKQIIENMAKTRGCFLPWKVKGKISEIHADEFSIM